VPRLNGHLSQMHKFQGGDCGYCRRNLTPPNVSSLLPR
jgi:hypothetical protein